MLYDLQLYWNDGEYAGRKTFHGQPLVGDCFVLDITSGSVLVYVVGRRWSQDGCLELTIHPEPK